MVPNIHLSETVADIITETQDEYRKQSRASEISFPNRVIDLLLNDKGKVTLDDLFSTGGIRSGVMGLLYLEVLDASFSFDGVIGAFALSSDIFIIMIGLGIGAMFVRSLTIYFVENKTLTEFKYLEHGANYAILALSLVMFYKIFGHISEILVGTIGITFIGIAVWHSIKEKPIS